MKSRANAVGCVVAWVSLVAAACEAEGAAPRQAQEQQFTDGDLYLFSNTIPLCEFGLDGFDAIMRIDPSTGHESIVKQFNSSGAGRANIVYDRYRDRLIFIAADVTGHSDLWAMDAAGNLSSLGFPDDPLGISFVASANDGRIYFLRDQVRLMYLDANNVSHVVTNLEGTGDALPPTPDTMFFDVSTNALFMVFGTKRYYYACDGLFDYYNKITIRKFTMTSDGSRIQSDECNELHVWPSNETGDTAGVGLSAGPNGSIMLVYTGGNGVQERMLLIDSQTLEFSDYASCGIWPNAGCYSASLDRVVVVDASVRNPDGSPDYRLRTFAAGDVGGIGEEFGDHHVSTGYALAWLAAIDKPQETGPITLTAPTSPDGSNPVTVTPRSATQSTRSDVQVTFSQVTVAGTTTAVVSPGIPSPPTPMIYDIGSSPQWYEIGTTAGYVGPITISIAYDPVAYVNQSILRLLHFDDGSWVDVTTGIDATNSRINGLVTSMSPFVIAQFIGPTAVAGPDQSIHAGQAVILDGTGSYDNNTSSDLLSYLWTFTSMPAGSAAHLSDSASSRPTFVTDLPGIYQLSLIVTDLDHFSSQPDVVQVSSINQPPTADAGTNIGGVVGAEVVLTGAGSSDPDNDPLAYSWTLVAKPKRSVVSLAAATGVSPSFTPDSSGTYRIQLIVNDGFAPSVPVTIDVTVITPVRYAEALTLSVIQTSKTLSPTLFTNAGNKKSFESLLLRASHAMQEDELKDARKGLQDAILRTDGWTLRGRADPDGASRDWVVDATTSVAFYAALTTALEEIAVDDQPCHEHDHESDDD